MGLFAFVYVVYNVGFYLAEKREDKEGKQRHGEKQERTKRKRVMLE